MIYDILEACQNGLDLLTIYLLFIGYNQREAAAMLHTMPSVIARRLKRLRNALSRSGVIPYGAGLFCFYGVSIQF